MNLVTALRRAAAAARVNLLPGLLLQALMVVFLAAYVTHDGTRHFLSQVESLKHEMGYFFAFYSYAISAGLLPEILQIGFFQQCRINRKNVWNMLTGIPAWGVIGMLVDFFYRCQIMWLGTGHDWQTVVAKMLIDQFLFSPLICAPLCVAYFLWRDARFRRSALKEILQPTFWMDCVLPVQVAAWCIWIPGVSLVYFMPSGLQIPVAVLIQTFWVLVFTIINRQESKRHQVPPP